MSLSNSRYFYDAFVLAEQDLQKITDAFQQLIDQPTFEVECRDGVHRRFDDLAKLLSFENVRSERIRSLWVRSSNDAKMRRARLRFSDASVPVYLEVAAETEVMAALDGAISGQLEKMQPRYFATNPFGLTLALLAGAASAVAVFSAILAIRSFWQASWGADVGAKALVIAVEALLFGLSVAAGWLANRPKGFLFPTAAFAIGREISRRRLLQVLRGGLFVVTAGFLLAVIVLNIVP